MPDNHVRTQLCFVIQQYGQAITTEPARCRDLLGDLAPQNRLEINLLIMALEQKIAEELLKPTASIPGTLQLEHFAQRLHENQGTQLEFAYCGRWSHGHWL